jgi:serine/threonine protein kinase/Tol biopolymer transport system component
VCEYVTEDDVEPDRRNRISELYFAASERAPEDRDAFLRAECAGDHVLRQEVESLLAYESASTRFLVRPAADLVLTSIDRVGHQLGPYQILALVGAGGMGEVYRAHDTKLGRDVAIKILPSNFVGDPERRTRLVREARVLATLNHPNIGAIYGLEEADGLTALVLEFVEGLTLSERLERGPLPVPEALTVARDVADALDAAHQKNVIHRDLKPSNIVLQPVLGRTGEVRAKVLDFGLAKMLMADGPAGEPSDHSTTRTVEGRILGTPAYMSPEQARGQPVDKRTDIWGFGCVLYEMLTARRPFEGSTQADTIAHVLERDPDWSAIPSGTPGSVSKLMRRCLEKEPTKRLTHIGEAREEIAAALTAVPTPQADGVGRLRSLVASPLVLGIMGLFAVALALVLTVGRHAPTEPLVRVARLTFDEGLQMDPALSPDGRFLTYASNKGGNFDLYTQPVNGGNPVQITQDAAHDLQPDWSVDAQIVFRSERDNGGLYVVGPTGGTEQRVAPFGERPVWSPDGTMILFGRLPSLKLYTVGLDGAPPRLCDQCYGGAYGWFGDAGHVATFSTGPVPQYAPDFRVVDIETARVNKWSANADVVKAFLELRLLVVRSTLVWDPSGLAFYFVGRTGGTSALWKLEVDRTIGRLTAGPHRLVTMTENATSVTIARDTGLIAFAAAAQSPRIVWYSLDSSGRRISGSPVTLTSPDLPPSDADVTADGSRLVFSAYRPAGSTAELRMKLLPDGVEQRLRVSNAARQEQRQRARWSPDGKRIVFRYVHPRTEGAPATNPLMMPQQLRVITVDTGEESDLTTTTARFVVPGGFSPDGTLVVAGLGNLPTTTQGMSVVLVPLAAAPTADAQMKIVTTHDGKSALLNPVMSANGRWIAFEVQGHTSRVAIVHSPDGSWDQSQPEGSWRYLDAVAMYEPRWSEDGRLLYFASERDGFANEWAVDFDPASGKIGEPFQVTGFDGRTEFMPLATSMSAASRGGLAARVVRPTGGIWLLRQNR